MSRAKIGIVDQLETSLREIRPADVVKTLQRFFASIGAYRLELCTVFSNADVFLPKFQSNLQGKSKTTTCENADTYA